MAGAEDDAEGLFEGDDARSRFFEEFTDCEEGCCVHFIVFADFRVGVGKELTGWREMEDIDLTVYRESYEFIGPETVGICMGEVEAVGFAGVLVAVEGELDV